MQVNLTDPRQAMNKGYTSFEVKSLVTIMKELKHEWIDVLKIDIEGAEWAVLKSLMSGKQQFPCTQMQVGMQAAGCGCGGLLVEGFMAANRGFGKCYETYLYRAIGLFWVKLQCNVLFPFQSLFPCSLPHEGG
jgi:hypothetical protein